MRRTAFTLLELLLVLIVLSLVAGAATLKLAPMLRAAPLEGTLRRLTEADGLARHRARQGQVRCRLVFDLDKQIVYRLEGDGQAHYALVRLKPCRIEQLRTASGLVSSGETALTVSRSGFAATYALEIRSERDARTRWLLFCGLSGQSEVFDDDADVEALFAALGKGADVD